MCAREAPSSFLFAASKQDDEVCFAFFLHIKIIPFDTIRWHELLRVEDTCIPYALWTCHTEISRSN